MLVLPSFVPFFDLCPKRKLRRIPNGHGCQSFSQYKETHVHLPFMEFMLEFNSKGPCQTNVKFYENLN